jgi:dihydroflavonol-4-reductase
MKSVLITGGTGFIGSNLAAQLLLLGCSVRILRRPESDLRALKGIDVQHCIGDLRDRESVQRAMKGCDTVFHTAAIVTFEQKKKTLQREVNVIGTRNVVDACLASNVERLVHTSSVAAVGHPRERELATETTPFNWPRTMGYKLSKYEAEQTVHGGVTRGLNAVIVNPSVVIGERDIHMHGGQLVKEVKRGLVPFYIDGGMNVVYVGDVVKGHILAAQKGRVGERYILGGHNMTHKEIFCRTAELVGGRSPFMRLPILLLRLGAGIVETASNIIGTEPLISSDLVVGAGLHNWFSCEKARRELGYTITSFDDAILAAYEWYIQNGFLQEN